jgi:hypothetical protein
MQKKAINPHSPPWPTGSPVSGSPYIPQYAVFLFSSLQIKSFRPLLLRVCLCFHSQRGLKNPEHLKFLCGSSVYHLLSFFFLIIHFLLGYIHYRGDLQWQFWLVLYYTLFILFPLSLPLNPIPTQLKTLTRFFSSISYRYMKVHQPYTFTLISFLYHYPPCTHCAYFTVLVFIINI